jgi:MSHA biogenesis protein MshE
VRESDLLQIIEKVYRKTGEIASIASELEGELKQTDFDLYALTGGDQVTDAPVVRLLQSIFEDAVNMGASDIHIEPDDKVVRIRQRIDGVLHEQIMKEARIAAALVSRLKIMSGLDISEKRLPQDGRFAIRVRNRSLDIRLSTMPVAWGESVVMRLLDQSAGLLDLEKLGMAGDIVARLKILIERPHGLILVTGPTGSGKTTTLYAALNHLNSPETKIITVEDPVEYRLPRITQVQVNTKIDLSFARVLRSALRQDPDVVLVGEMRDQETAEIGLRAAMTGHLVFSTLHTNDAAASAMRLIDMGAASFLVASSLRAVLAQRLVRKVCEHCRELYQPDAQEQEWLRQLSNGSVIMEQFWHGKGCTQCNNTGYHGRFGVHELLEMTPTLLDALRRSDAAGFAHAATLAPGFEPLARAALRAAVTGKTSVEEVLRITASLDTGYLNSELLKNTPIDTPVFIPPENIPALSSPNPMNGH